MGWASTHEHSWQWATDSDDLVLSLVIPGYVFGWQICRCGQWRVRVLEGQSA